MLDIKRRDLKNRQDFIQLAKKHGRNFKLIAEKLGADEKLISARADYILKRLRQGKIPMDQDLLEKLTPKI